VTNSWDNTVSVVDLTVGQEVDAIAVGDYPMGIALSPDGTRAYVACNAGTLDVLDVVNGVRTAVVAIGVHPRHVVVDPTGAYAYVTWGDASGYVAVIETAGNTPVANIPVGSIPQGICIAPDGSTLYTADAASGTCSVVDIATRSVVATVDLGGGYPEGICMQPDGSRVYLTHYYGSRVSVIDTAHHALLTTIPMAATPACCAVTPDGAYLLVGHADAKLVRVVDTGTYSVLDDIACGATYGLAIAPDGLCAYASDHDQARLWVLGPASALAFSGWQMADANGVVNLPIRLSTLADPRVFDYMPARTSDWYPCPGATEINWYTSSNCTAYVQAYYKYFRTFLYASPAMAGQTIYVRADGHIDDVVNVVVNGVDTGGYLHGLALPGSRQADITSYLNFGQVNEILFRFADTAALNRGITQVSICTGTGMIATYDPTIGADQVTITSITADPLTLPAGGGTAQCSVTASDSLGHALSYAWTASSSLGTGTFDDPTSPTPTWTSPANNTGSDVTATLTVTATCGGGQSAQASVMVTIARRPADTEAPRIMLDWRNSFAVMVRPYTPIEVAAQITDNVGVAAAVVHYYTPGVLGGWREQAMTGPSTRPDGTDNWYVATLPGLDPARGPSTLACHVDARDAAGNTARCPLEGEEIQVMLSGQTGGGKEGPSNRYSLDFISSVSLLPYSEAWKDDFGGLPDLYARYFREVMAVRDDLSGLRSYNQTNTDWVLQAQAVLKGVNPDSLEAGRICADRDASADYAHSLAHEYMNVGTVGTLKRLGEATALVVTGGAAWPVVGTMEGETLVVSATNACWRTAWGSRLRTYRQYQCLKAGTSLASIVLLNGPSLQDPNGMAQFMEFLTAAKAGVAITNMGIEGSGCASTARVTFEAQGGNVPPVTLRALGPGVQ
jgi:YVTN family beta-propeller protein